MATYLEYIQSEKYLENARCRIRLYSQLNTFLSKNEKMCIYINSSELCTLHGISRYFTVRYLPISTRQKRTLAIVLENQLMLEYFIARNFWPVFGALTVFILDVIKSLAKVEDAAPQLRILSILNYDGIRPNLPLV